MNSGFNIIINKQDASKILRLLIIWETFLLIAYAIMHIIAPDVRYGFFDPLFDMDIESSVPTWFSSVQLMVIAILLYSLSSSSLKYRWFYVFGALIFVFLSVDESVEIHERISAITVAHDIGALKSIMIGGHGAWILPYILLALLILFIARRPIIDIYRNHRKPFLYVFFGALIAAVGLVGLEILSYLGLREPGSELAFSIEVAAEEFLEMLGVSIILYGIILLGREIQSIATDSEK